VLSFVSVSTSMLFWVIFLLPFSEHDLTMIPQIIRVPFQNLKYTSLRSCRIPLCHIFKVTCTWPVQANLNLYRVNLLISQWHSVSNSSYCSGRSGFK
jgi:hypothetical protein